MKRSITIGLLFAWSQPALAQQKGAAADVPVFCRTYVDLAGDLAGVAEWFVIAALILGVGYAIVETIKKYKEGPVAPRLTTGTIKELIDALRAFIEALASARAWLALFACGILLFALAGAMIPPKCDSYMIDPVPPVSRPDAGPANDGAGRLGDGIENPGENGIDDNRR